MKKLILIFALFLLLPQVAWGADHLAGTYYVSQAGAGDGSGSSELNAISLANHNTDTWHAPSIIYIIGSITGTLTPPSSGASALSKIVYRGDSTTPGILANTTGNSLSLATKSYLSFVSLTIASASTTNPNKAINITGACAGLLFDTMTIGMSGAVATSYLCTSSGALTASTFSNLTCTGYTANAFLIYGAGSGALTFTNVKSVGGTNSFDLSEISGVTLTNVDQSGHSAIGIKLGQTVTGVFSGTSIYTKGGTTGLYLSGCTLTAISTLANSRFAGASNAGLGNYKPANLVVSNCTAIGNTGDGFQDYGSYNISYTNCTASGSGAFGFWAKYGSHDITYTSCTAQGGASDGMGATDADDVTHLLGGTTCYNLTYLKCISAGNGAKTTTSEGDGFTFHFYEYGINLIECLSYNNTASGMAVGTNSSGNVYNSVFYANGGDWRSTGGLDQTRGGMHFVITGVTPIATNGNGWRVKNTISSGNYPFEINLSTADGGTTHWTTFDYNLYNPLSAVSFATLNQAVSGNSTWAQWRALGYDSNSPTPSDPLLNSNFTLQSGSPAIHAGTKAWVVDLTGAQSDSNGNSRTIGPHYTLDMGAYPFDHWQRPSIISGKFLSGKLVP